MLLSDCSGWRRRWWSHLSVAVQRAVCSTALGGDWIAPALPAGEEPSQALILAGAEPTGPSRLPLR